jgi:ribonuclease P protein component
MASGAEGSARGRHLLRLSPQDRLRKRFEFGRVRDQGRRVHTQSFVLLLRPNQLDRSRLGLTVSHKVGNAVRRNRIKRLLREVFRQHRSLFPAAADVVVIAKAGRAPSGLEQVCGELGRASGAMRAAVELLLARGPARFDARAASRPGHSARGPAREADGGRRRPERSPR